MTALLMLFLALSSSSRAENGIVNVNARVWPLKATIGDEIKLIVTVDRPKDVSIQLPTPDMNLAPFELKRAEVSASSENQGRVREALTLTLTTFELGDLNVPPVVLRYTDAQGRTRQVSTPSVGIKIVNVANHPKEKDDIRSIKGPVHL